MANSRGARAWSSPSRWWLWLVLAFGLWALSWAQAAADAPYVVEVTLGSTAASFVRFVFLGAAFFQAGAQFRELQRSRLDERVAKGRDG